jgi:TANFOR domain-containing protein
MPKFLKPYYLFLLLLWVKTSFAQVYPVQGNAALVPPFSLKLSDYANSVTDRLAVNVLLNDVAKPDLKIRLRIRIEGQNVKLETKSEYFGTALTLQGGVPLRLTNIDLAEYFNPSHLNFSGITQSEFLKTASLPEGFYQFCFEVLEYNRGVKISNTICAPAWLILNNPPLVNLPRNGEILRTLNPQNVIFQWTPRHTGSPNSAFSTEYDFKLVELWPANRNPNDAILTQPAIYETTTNSSLLVYGPDATPLEPGRQYAFRVRARSITGMDELDLFKNNGYSEVVTFQYGDACTTPNEITADPGSTRIGLHWLENSNHTGYSAKYRMVGSENWYTTNSSTPEVFLSSLKTTTRYEYQVAASCGSFESTYSPVAIAITKESPLANYSCGLPPENFNLDPSQLLLTLKTGDVIKSGDFDVFVTKVTGSNGIFGGEGVVMVPFLNQAKARTVFTSISVNNDMRLVSGTIHITGGGLEVVPQSVLNAMDKLSEILTAADSALNLASLFLNTNPPNPNSFVADTLVKVKGEIVNVFKDPASGKMVVVTSDGKRTTLPAGTNVALVDEKGNGVIVDQNGKKTNTTTAIAKATAKREYNLNLAFNEDGDKTKYGLDKKEKDSKLTTEYQVLGKDYAVAWKAIAANGTDNIAAHLEGSGIDQSKIKYELEGQIVSKSQSLTPNSQSLLLTGKAAGVTEELLAKLPPPDTTKKEQILGKLFVVNYAAETYTLKIIPVGDASATAINTTTLKTDLDKIYGQAVVNWNVELVTTPLQVPGISNPLDDGVSGLLSNYTDDQKKVINAFKAKNPLQPKTFYLFLISSSKSGRSGYMPRSKQMGFIYVKQSGDQSAMTTVIAHELGHGAFHLKHSWKEKPVLDSASTDNLMDYKKGKRLLKFQWDHIHNPEMVVGLFEDDEDGASVSETGLEQVARIINTLNCGYVNNHQTADLHYGSTRFEVNLGKLASMLNSGAPIIASEEFKNAQLVVWFGGYSISEPFLTYNDITLKLSEYKYSEGSKIIIPGNVGGAIGFQVSELNFRAPLKKTDVFNWLIKTIGKGGDGTALFKVDNSKSWKVEDLILLSPCDLALLSRPNRLKLISELVDKQESFGFDKDTYQYLLINTLKYTPQEDQLYFYQQLSKNPKWILYPFEVMATDQKEKFVKLITEWWLKYRSTTLVASNAVLINYSIFNNPNNLVDHNSDFTKIIFKRRGLNNVANYIPEITLCSPSPLEEIEVSFKTQNVEQRATLLPAILVKYMIDNGNYQDVKDLGWTTLNIASLVTGVGEINLGIQTFRNGKYVLGAFRFLLATGNILSTISSTYCTQGRASTDFCKAWAEYEILISVGLLSASSLDLLYAKLSKAYKELPLGSFSDEQKKLLESELRLADDIEFTPKILYPTVKINGVPVVRLMEGYNGKIAIVGRKMEYVRQVADDLKKLGKQVELFEKTTAFNGLGYNKLAEIETDWQHALVMYGQNGVIPYDKLKITLWYKENQRWAKWIKEQGYDIYDLGDNPGLFTNAPDRSAFYDIEKIEIFGDVIK